MVKGEEEFDTMRKSLTSLVLFLNFVLSSDVNAVLDSVGNIIHKPNDHLFCNYKGNTLYAKYLCSTVGNKCDFYVQEILDKTGRKLHYNCLPRILYDPNTRECVDLEEKHNCKFLCC
ncbi:hypothetical protein HYU23_02410 [Candidatus Woesearchaeota archaeon]|nr:hypothetical protein [Candidatus Woesearchaeota archaeon]